MRFEDAFPELTASPPKLPGTPALPPTKLQNLRLQQLRYLARAYEIPIDFDAPKPKILPALAAAEAAGAFAKPPKHELYLLKAARTPDDPPLEHEEYDPSGTYPRVPRQAQDEEVPVPAVPPSEMNHAQLQQACKQAGVNSFGMGADKMREALHGLAD